MKPAHADLKTEIERLETQNYLKDILLQDYITGATPDESITFILPTRPPHSMAEYTFELRRAKDPHGGIIVRIYNSNTGINPQIHLDYFDRWYDSIKRIYLSCPSDADSRALYEITSRMKQERDRLAA